MNLREVAPYHLEDGIDADADATRIEESADVGHNTDVEDNNRAQDDSGCTDKGIEITGNTLANDVLRRTTRERRQPSWLKDFAT